jgi:proliferating cell nuclear antigen PCNA
MTTPGPDDCVVYATTIEAQRLKILCATLKSLLTQASFVFTPAGISMEVENDSKSCFVQLNLEAAKFNEFKCAVPRLTVGFDTEHIVQLLERVGNDDTLTLYVQSKDSDTLGIVVRNTKEKRVRVSELTSLEADDYVPAEIEEHMYGNIFNIPSTMLQKEIMPLAALSRKVDLRAFGDRLELWVTDSSYVRRHCSSIDVSSADGADGGRPIAQGVFPLPALQNFMKCTPLSPSVEIDMANDRPLLLSFHVGSLGRLRFALKPCPGGGRSSA